MRHKSTCTIFTLHVINYIVFHFAVKFEKCSLSPFAFKPSKLAITHLGFTCNLSALWKCYLLMVLF